jgi:thioredoxin 1
MLHTHLSHVDDDATFQKLLQEQENVMLCCGREGPMCLPVYDVMEKLQDKYPDVAFRDMNFDGPAAHLIKALPQTRSFSGLPFTIYFKKGKVVGATSSIQSKQQVKEMLEKSFSQSGVRAA